MSRKLWVKTIDTRYYWPTSPKAPSFLVSTLFLRCLSSIFGATPQMSFRAVNDAIKSWWSTDRVR